MYGFEIVHVLVLTYVAYILMGVTDRLKQHIYVTAWVFAYLSYVHYDAYINRFMTYDMGVATYSMLQVLKLHALCWNYRDGGTDIALLTTE